MKPPAVAFSIAPLAAALPSSTQPRNVAQKARHWVLLTCRYQGRTAGAGVVGGGTMGAGIAQVAAQAGHAVSGGDGHTDAHAGFFLSNDVGVQSTGGGGTAASFGGSAIDSFSQSNESTGAAVAAAAVRNDHLVGYCQGGREVAPQGFLFVKGGNDDRQSHAGC